jgi:hypothetical protein
VTRLFVDRPRSLLIGFALALCLIAGSPPRIVGDGGEYLAMALNFAGFHRPALAGSDIPRIQQTIAQTDSILSNWDIRAASVAGHDGRRDFLHFWFYPLLAVPALWVTQAIGVTPIVAFIVLNLTVLGLALWILLPRLGTPACLLLFGGPILWWIDKPHTEGFTFALLAIALALMRERPWWSMLAAGAAATQNPPIAILVGLILAAQVISNRQILRDRRFLIGALGGIGLAVLQPAYTYIRHGSPSLLLLANPSRRPTLAEMLAVPFDPSVGLVANYPVFAVVCVVAVIIVLARKPRALISPDAIVAILAGISFLAAFAQATNVHHGATPSMSRYAIWLVPLAIPALWRAEAVGGALWTRFLWCAAVISAAVCAFIFHPAVLQNTREPTLAANYLWTRHPSWNNPLPEIFAETLLRREDRLVPVTTPGCEKVLLIGRSEGGAWPIPCFPGELPNWCATGSLCYANRDDDHYRFARPAGPPIQHEGFVHQAEWAWPASAEPHVRALFTQWDWGHLRPKAGGEDVLRFARDVHVWELEGPGRFVFILREPRGDPTISLRLPTRMTGVIVDAMSGQTVRGVQFDGPPFERWELKLGSGFDVLLLSLWTT